MPLLKEYRTISKLMPNRYILIPHCNVVLVHAEVSACIGQDIGVTKMLATIIIPETIGSPNANCHAEVRDALEATFGGWTAHEATGGWKSVTGEATEETVTVYNVAMDDTVPNRQSMQ